MSKIPKHRDRIRAVIADIRVALLRDATAMTEPVKDEEVRINKNELVVTDPDDVEYVITVNVARRSRRV
jgi:hypothetical protein